MSQKLLDYLSLYCLKLNVKNAYLQGKLRTSKMCITLSKNTKKCIPQKGIASRNLTKIACTLSKIFETFDILKYIRHNSIVHIVLTICTMHTRVTKVVADHGSEFSG